MIILACDPGPEKSSFVWFDSESRRVTSAMDYSNVQAYDRLSQFEEYDIFVIEKVACMGMAVGAEVFETVFWTGIFCERARPKTYHRIKRGEIKMHLCGSMRAKDANIRQALIDKLGPQGTKKNPGPTYGISKHLWSALAVAVTYAETH